LRFFSPAGALSCRQSQACGGALQYRFENYVLDCGLRELRRGTELIAVEPQVFDLLTFLIHHRDRVVSKDDLMAAIWNRRIVSESALTSRINSARAALRDTGEEQRLIKTLRGKGFRFVGAVSEAERTSRAMPASPATPTSWTPLLGDQPSIAVLPFVNMSGDPAQDYFADGMTEEIITALARFKSLFVIARNSSFAYRGHVADIKQIARELGVRCARRQRAQLRRSPAYHRPVDRSRDWHAYLGQPLRAAPR
jgi:DNA-binding winged helix-turn-helix (wHTH) protein